MKKRMLSLVTVLALCLSLLPATALAADGRAAIVLGTDHLAGGQADSVYFGNYQQASAGSTQPSGTDWIKDDTATYNGQGP